MTRKQIEKRVFGGKCYSFALGFVNERLLKRGQWTAETTEEAIKMSSTLSREVQKTINDFFGRQPRARRSG